MTSRWPDVSWREVPGRSGVRPDRCDRRHPGLTAPVRSDPTASVTVPLASSAAPATGAETPPAVLLTRSTASRTVRLRQHGRLVCSGRYRQQGDAPVTDPGGGPGSAPPGCACVGAVTSDGRIVGVRAPITGGRCSTTRRPPELAPCPQDSLLGTLVARGPEMESSRSPDRARLLSWPAASAQQTGRKAGSARPAWARASTTHCSATGSSWVPTWSLTSSGQRVWSRTLVTRGP
jgi:hypothetical protein